MEPGRCVYVVNGYGDAVDGRLCGLAIWRNARGTLTCPLGHVRSESDHAWIEKLDGLTIVAIEREGT